MNIQISVMVWTVICFLLLTLILRNLLFKPLLSCMDQREKKISDARRKQQQDQEQRASEAARMKASLDAYNTQAREAAEKEVAREQISAEHQTEEREKAEADACAAYQSELEEEKQALSARIQPKAERLVDLMMSGFVS